MADARPWVVDTSTFTHLSRAGHVQIVRELAPDGVVLVPSDVNDEIERGRLEFPGIPAIGTLDWVQLVVLTEDEVWTQLDIKAQMGGRPIDHRILPVHGPSAGWVPAPVAASACS